MMTLGRKHSGAPHTLEGANRSRLNRMISHRIYAPQRTGQHRRMEKIESSKLHRRCGASGATEGDNHVLSTLCSASSWTDRSS